MADLKPRRWTGSLFIMCLLLGCRRESAETPSEEPVLIRDIEADALSRIRGLGSGAPFMIVLDAADETWPRVRDYLLAIGVQSKQRFSDTNLNDPVLGALRLLGLRTDAVALQERDRARPVVFALADPIVDGPPGLPSLTLRDPKAVRLRYVIDVPTSYPHRLVLALDGAFKSAGRAWPALVADIPGALARELAGRGALAFLPEATAVRVVVITDAGARDPSSDLQAFVEDLRPSVAEVEPTPALDLAARPGFDATVYVRPWRLRALAASQGMGAMHKALSTIDPEFQPSAFSAGLNIVMDCERLLSEPREVDDWAVGIVADGPKSRTTVIASLTERGRRISREVVTDVRPLRLRRDDVLANGFLGLTSAADDDPLAKDTRRILKQCGLLAPASLAFNSPMTWGSAAAQDIDGGLGAVMAVALAARPRGLQVAVVPTLLGASGVAIAAIDPPVDRVEQLTADLKRHSATAFVESHRDHVVVLAGVGVDPRDVFDTTVEGERSGFFQWRADPRALPKFQTSGRLDIVQGIVVGETVGAALTLTATPPVVSRASPRTPQGEADLHALECLRRAEARIVRALVGMNEIGVRHATSKLGEWLGAAGPDLECARAHEDTRVASETLLSHARSETSATLVGIGETKAATIFVERSCKQSDDGCAMLTKLRALPQVVLPSIPRTPSCLEQTLPSAHGIAVLIADGRIAIAGEVVPAEPAAIVAALKRVRPPAPKSLDVYLFVDHEVELGAVVPVLEAVWSLGETMVLVGSMSSAGFAATGLEFRRSSRPSSLPLGQSWQSFVEDLAVHCELAAIDF